MEILARHPRIGDCIIREVVATSGRVKVLVDYPTLDLRRQSEYLDELVDRQTGGHIALNDASPRPAVRANNATPPPTWQTARQTLLALRLGQSTFESVPELSVGMGEIDTACGWALDRATTGQLSFLLFESPYGMGKSHALAQLKHHAFKQSMAVGTVTLDGAGITLCEPMSLLSGLAHAIEFPDERHDEGLPQRLTQRAGIGLNITGGELLHQLLTAMNRDCADNPDKWERIEDYLSLDATSADLRRELGIKVPALRARRRDERPERCSTVIREWASACTVLGARNGLVVLLDEADVDYAQGGRTQDDRDQRTGLLSAFRSIADSQPGYGGFARLVIAMAITPGASKPDPIEELTVELGSHLRVVRLRELSAGELMDLGNRVTELYRRAYEIADDEAKAEKAVKECLQLTERQVEGRNPRRFIRLLLEKLDVLYA
jgi:hypothetical protein